MSSNSVAGGTKPLPRDVDLYILTPDVRGLLQVLFGPGDALHMAGRDHITVRAPTFSAASKAACTLQTILGLDFKVLGEANPKEAERLLYERIAKGASGTMLPNMKVMRETLTETMQKMRSRYLGKMEGGKLPNGKPVLPTLVVIADKILGELKTELYNTLTKQLASFTNCKHVQVLLLSTAGPEVPVVSQAWHTPPGWNDEHAILITHIAFANGSTKSREGMCHYVQQLMSAHSNRVLNQMKGIKTQRHLVSPSSQAVPEQLPTALAAFAASIPEGGAAGAFTLGDYMADSPTERRAKLDHSNRTTASASSSPGLAIESSAAASPDLSTASTLPPLPNAVADSSLSGFTGFVTPHGTPASQLLANKTRAAINYATNLTPLPLSLARDGSDHRSSDAGTDALMLSPTDFAGTPWGGSSSGTMTDTSPYSQTYGITLPFDYKKSFRLPYEDSYTTTNLESPTPAAVPEALSATVTATAATAVSSAPVLVCLIMCPDCVRGFVSQEQLLMVCAEHEGVGVGGPDWRQLDGQTGVKQVPVAVYVRHDCPEYRTHARAVILKIQSLIQQAMMVIQQAQSVILSP